MDLLNAFIIVNDYQDHRINYEWKTSSFTDSCLSCHLGWTASCWLVVDRVGSLSPPL